MIEIIEKSREKNINLYQYLEDRKGGDFIYTIKIIEELNEIDEEFYLEDLIVLAFWDGLDKRYTNILCDLLNKDWHELHEDIVMMLEVIKDEKSIETLYLKALDIPDYDDGRSLAKKCIWALQAINTPKSIEKLKLLKESDDPIIKESVVIPS